MHINGAITVTLAPRNDWCKPIILPMILQVQSVEWFRKFI